VITDALIRQTTFVPDENTDKDSMKYILARSDVEHYLKYGYVSLEASPLYERDGKPVSLALSYAYDDYVLGSLCLAEAKDSASSRSVQECARIKMRGQIFKSIWSSDRQLMRPRHSQNGEFVCPDDPAGKDSWQMWTEGDTY
jgi:putative alpha-1,2-mannosidase